MPHPTSPVVPAYVRIDALTTITKIPNPLSILRGEGADREGPIIATRRLIAEDLPADLHLVTPDLVCDSALP
jgi:hypothetical protein